MDYNKTVFLDTNIILDIVDSNRINNKKAVQLWSILVRKQYTITISEDMLSIIFYINKDKRQTLNFFKIITNRWKIVPFGKEKLPSGTTR